MVIIINSFLFIQKDIFGGNMNNTETYTVCWIRDKCHFVQPSLQNSMYLPLLKLESIILTELDLITYIQKYHRQNMISNDCLFIYRN